MIRVSCVLWIEIDSIYEKMDEIMVNFYTDLVA